MRALRALHHAESALRIDVPGALQLALLLSATAISIYVGSSPMLAVRAQIHRANDRVPAVHGFGLVARQVHGDSARDTEDEACVRGFD